MNEITPAEFIARFSEFSTVDPALIQGVINEVLYFLVGYQSSRAYKILQLYLTAHMLSIQLRATAGDTNASNPFTSATVGSVSESVGLNVGSMSTIESQWNSTSYGQKFFQFLKQARYEIAPYGVI